MSRSTSHNGPQGNSTSWLQGLVIGICIGGAFIGGWLLARQESHPNAVVAAKVEVRDEKQGPGILPVPVVAAPEKSVAQAALEVREVAPVVVATPPVSPAPAVAEEKPAAPEVVPVKPAAAPAVPAKETPVAETPAKPNGLAQLQIVSKPEAQVFAVEGARQIYVGQADAEGKLFLRRPVGPAGVSVTLLFRHPDCEPLQKADVRMVRGETTTVEAPLRSLPGGLTIIPEPTAAAVWVDGESVGKGVVSLGTVDSNVRHIVEVKLAGMQTASREVAVVPSEITTVKIALAPEEKAAVASAEQGDILLLGAVYALTQMPGARVKIDGNPTAAPDGLIQKVSSGTRQLVIEQGGENVVTRVLWRGPVEVRPGEATSLRDVVVQPGAELPKETGDAELIGGEKVRLELSFINLRGEPQTPENVTVTFGDVRVSHDENGIWILPARKRADLRVEVPEFEPVVRRGKEYALGGNYPLVVVLRPPAPKVEKVAAPEPTPAGNSPEAEGKTISWEAEVLASAPQEGLFVLGQPEQGPLLVGQELTVEVAGAGTLYAEVIESAEKMVICAVTESPEHLAQAPKDSKVKVSVQVKPAEEIAPEKKIEVNAKVSAEELAEEKPVPAK